MSWPGWDTTRSSGICHLLKPRRGGRFRGCYNRKKLSHLNWLQEGEELLLNTDHHWTALKLRRNTFLYFDPQGDKGEVRQMTGGRPTFSNPTPVQSRASRECGLFCVLFILSVEDIPSFTTFLKGFTQPCSLVNDRIARYALCNQLND